MEVEKSTERLLGRQLWCSVCVDKRPSETKPSTHWVLYREYPYEMLRGGNDIDQRRVGVCKECLQSKNPFQIRYAQKIPRQKKDPVYKDP